MAITQSFTRTLPSPVSTHDGFVFLLSTGWFTQANQGAAGSPIDGGAKSLANGGGDLQAFSDEACTQRLPVEVVEFITGVSPSAQVWVRLPTWASGDTITIGRDSAQTVQPPVTDIYGRNAVHQDLAFANHGRDYVNSAGGDPFVEFNSAPVSRDVLFGGGHEFDGTNMLIAPIATPAAMLPMTISGWQVIKAGETVGDPIGGVSMAAQGLGGANDFTVQGRQSSTPACFAKASYPFNKTLTSSINQVNAAMYSQPVYTVFTVNTDGSYILHSKNSVGESTRTGVISDYANIALDAFGIGGRADSSESPAPGAITESRGGHVFRAQDWLDDEYTNQSDPDSFGTSSAWIDVGGGGGVIDSEINAAIAKPEFSASALVTVPAPSSGVGFGLLAPEFSASSSVTLPNPSADIDLSITKPVFNASSFVTIPAPASNITTEIEKPLFSGLVSVTEPAFNSSVDFDIDKPQFSAASSVTLPKPTSTLELTISKPVFSVYSFVSGTEIIASEDAKIKVDFGSNLINIDAESNKLELKAYSNKIKVEI